MVRNTIARNTFYLFVSNVGVRGITAVATILLARYLGAKDFGVISVALAWSAVALFFTDMGVTQTFVREGTKADADIPPLVGGSLKIRIGLAILATIVSIPLIALYSDPTLRHLTYLVVIPTIWGGALQAVGTAYFLMSQEMQYTALIRIVSGLATAVVLVIGILLRWPLNALGLAYGSSSILGGILSVALVYRRVPTVRGWHHGLLEGIGAFTLGGLLLLLLPQLGPLTLERFSNLQQTGYFAAASRIPVLLYQVPGMVATAFYPQLFSYGATDHERHLQLSSLELKLMSLLAVGMSLPFILYPHWILKILLGQKWAVAASSTLVALSWAVILQGLNFPLADALTTRGYQNRRTAVTAVSFVVGLVLYAILGARMGALGAALAAVAVQVTMLVGYTATNPIGIPLLSSGLGASCVAIIGSTALGLLVKAAIPLEWLGVFLTPVIFTVFCTSVDRDIRFRVLRTLRISAG